VASGRAAFSTARARELAKDGNPVILARPDTSTEDVAGFAVAQGILTTVGGRTAHAAAVARQLGKVCLVGCHALAIDETTGEATLAGTRLREGDWLSLDGDTGSVVPGERAIVSQPPEELAEVQGWRRAIASAPAGSGQ
jgi:pyruvate,orthophosphate dikinase